jgi:ubiquinone/menaquinone biosynthesis C-methylase UbiE
MLESLYKIRFNTSKELETKNRIWQVLCKDFFQKYISEKAIIVDLAAGYCEFINNIIGKKKIAVDLNTDTKSYANSDVDYLNENVGATSLKESSVDFVFMSNFLEHLGSKEDILDVLKEANRMLRIGGSIIILQPNIKYVGGSYWDFFDHKVPLTDKSLVEALKLSGFQPHIVIPRFLPYTTKSALPKTTFLIKIYLRIPLLWRIFGKQTLVIATKGGMQCQI